MKVLLATNNMKSSFQELYPDLSVYDMSGGDFPRWSGDLLIFTGGEDINPAMYRQRPNGTHSWNASRDDVEKNVFYLWKEGHIKATKVLGVCRGIQILNALLGGNLIQDLYSVGKGHKGYHPIEWSPGTIKELADIRAVNSLHHQAVNVVAGSRKFSILAEEPRTKVVEAVLWDNNIFGVQFHPEWLGDALRTLFFTAIEKWVKGQHLITLPVSDSKERVKRNIQNPRDNLYSFKIGRVGPEETPIQWTEEISHVNTDILEGDDDD